MKTASSGSCDEVDFERGVYVQRIWTGELDGSDDENWGTYESPKYLGFVAMILPEKMNRKRGFCNYYIVQEEKNITECRITVAWSKWQHNNVFTQFHDFMMQSWAIRDFQISRPILRSIR